MKSLICRVEDSSSGRYLEARTEIVGDDVVVAIGGGERPHVGCVGSGPIRCAAMQGVIKSYDPGTGDGVFLAEDGPLAIRRAHSLPT